MATPREMIVNVRAMLEEESEIGDDGFLHEAGEWSDSEILHWLNLADLHLVKKIVEADEQYFEDTDTSLGFIKDQLEYDFSSVFGGRVWKVTAVSRLDDNGDETFYFTVDQFQDQNQYQDQSIATLIIPYRDRFYIRGTKIGLLPTPQETKANNVKLYFNVLPAKMHVGKCGAQPSSNVSTTFTMASSPILGSIRKHATDYYKGMKVQITSGTGEGQIRTITGFNRSTLVATVDSAWDDGGTPNTNSVYEILPQGLEQYQEILELYAVLGLMAKDDESYKSYNRLYSEKFDDLINTIRDRQTSEPRRVRYIPDE